jgi:WS/DGAT/MGAT family acyltransferase
MKRLTGLDATFLNLETPTIHMHVAGLGIFDPRTGDGNWSYDRAIEVYRERLHLAPPFRQRLVEVPFGLHHPLWIEDPDFDLEWHIRHIAVPAPGGPRQLADLVAHLNAIPLDRTRPLWEMWIIEGLPDGHIAVLTKVHHAAIDGASGNELNIAILDLTPEPATPPPPEKEWEPDRVPTAAELLAYAGSSLARQPFRVARAMQKTAGMAMTLRQRNREPNVSPPPAPFSAPRTSFNTAITPHRSYAYTSLSLPMAKAVKNAAGVTLNDVVLGICAGALRRWLDQHDEHPDGPLVAMVPISVRSEDLKSAMGNQVSSMLTTLATDLDDPVQRLKVIHGDTVQAKEQHEVIGADTLTQWAEFAAPALAGRAARLYSRMRVADRMRPIFNVTISNVPGPPFPLYSAGARLVANYPVGPIADGMGVNMTVMSYMDQLDFGVQACPDVLPDVWELVDGLHDALEELADAVGVERGSVESLTRVETPA